MLAMRRAELMRDVMVVDVVVEERGSDQTDVDSPPPASTYTITAIGR
jgi:hypothetical protein